MTVAGDCGATSTTSEVISIVLGLNNLAVWDEFILNPNPSDGLFNMTLVGENTSELWVNVYSVLGRRVFSRSYNFTSGKLNEMLDLGDVSNGTYLVQVQADNKVAYRRLVVTK